MRKVRIGTILRLSCAKFRSEHCAGNPWIVQQLAHALQMLCTCTFNRFACVCWFVYVGWRMAHRETSKKWTKETFLSGKKVGSKVSLLLDKVTIDFQSGRLCSTFPSSTLYTSPSMIDFWSWFLHCMYFSLYIHFWWSFLRTVRSWLTDYLPTIQ